jgi:hypothetical protein
LGWNKGFGCGTSDVSAIGFPLIGEDTEAISISDGLGVGGECLSLCGRAVDDDGACWTVVADTTIVLI